MSTNFIPASKFMPSLPFRPDSLGYIRQWLISGPGETLYQGPPGADDVLRREALDLTRVEPPKTAVLHTPGPLGAWRFYYPGENFFVEHSTFYYRLTLIDSYAFTAIESPMDALIEARFWVAGGADLWVNGAHITRYDATRYMFPDARAVVLPLRRGNNTLCVRLQCLGLRDTRNLFGLQLVRDGENLTVRHSGAAGVREKMIEAAHWLDGVRTAGSDALSATGPAPANVGLEISGAAAFPWPEGANRISLGSRRPFRIKVGVMVDGQTIERSLEIPVNRTASALVSTATDFRRAQLEFIASLPDAPGEPVRGVHGIPSLTARRLLGQKHPDDAAAFASALQCIDRREDCADFGLAMLLRLHLLGLATVEESALIKRAALAFRYWPDEPGNDAMCFTTENHSLLFHGCQRIAGLTFPNDIFLNSGRTGAEHAALALDRCRKWLDHVEPRGFDEFLSAVYMPITVTALLNLVDFSGDAEVSRRAAGLIDQIYRDLALHSFRGITIAPQGRAYRSLLYPESSGTQALLSYATQEAVADFEARQSSPLVGRIGDWAVFVGSSTAYHPPGDLADLMRRPVSRRSRQADVEIVLHKTRDYLLTSLSIPAPFTDDEGKPAGMQPGTGGYQQHLWQATLAPGCHVFVNHPGGSFDESYSRPGYWNGNGIVPRLRQQEHVLWEIFALPREMKIYPDRPSVPVVWPVELHPIPFTHAHWPSDAFDRHEVRGNWAFGWKDTGCIALWCSEELRPHDDVFTGRELRAWAPRCAWLAICGSAEAEHDFLGFIESCVARAPTFNRESLALVFGGMQLA